MFSQRSILPFTTFVLLLICPFFIVDKASKRHSKLQSSHVNDSKRRLDSIAIYKTVTKTPIHYQDRELIWHTDETKNWTILLELNNGAFELFQNWYIYFLKLFIKYQVIVIAEDDIVFKKLKSDHYASIQVHRSDYINIPNASSYNTPLFRKLMSVAQHIF
jgi:hypothetical protein